jgi:nucleotide-binding universal stress UspA family protein
MSRILVPLDGSPLAEAVMPIALELGQALQATWVLLQVVVPPEVVAAMEAGIWGPGPTEGLLLPPATETRDEARRYLEALRDRHPDPTRVVVDVREDLLPRGILRAITEHQATHVAMSTHGRGGAGRLVMGSVTDMVIRLAGVPVVVVRPWTHGGMRLAGKGGGRHA